MDRAIFRRRMAELLALDANYESVKLRTVDRRREYLRRVADWLVGDDVEDRKRLGEMVKAESRLSLEQRQDRDAPHIARYGWSQRGEVVSLKSKTQRR